MKDLENSILIVYVSLLVLACTDYPLDAEELYLRYNYIKDSNSLPKFTHMTLKTHRALLSLFLYC